MKNTFLLILIIIFIGVTFVTVFLVNYKPNNKNIAMQHYLDDNVAKIEQDNIKMEEKIAEKMGLKIEEEANKTNTDDNLVKLKITIKNSEKSIDSKALEINIKENDIIYFDKNNITIGVDNINKKEASDYIEVLKINNSALELNVNDKEIIILSKNEEYNFLNKLVSTDGINYSYTISF